MKKRKSLTDGMGKIDDSVLERYDKIDAELETKKAAMARKRKFAVISTVSVAAALVLLMMPFALKNLLGLIPIGTDESTVDPPPLVSPSESTTEESTPEDSTPIESTPTESTPRGGNSECACIFGDDTRRINSIRYEHRYNSRDTRYNGSRC